MQVYLRDYSISNIKMYKYMYVQVQVYKFMSDARWKGKVARTFN